MVLVCGGPLGAGMEEIYQVTSALKHLSYAKRVAVLTDARFSGVSTGACIGHISPEALAGGPIGRIQDGDVIEIIIDRAALVGSVDLVGSSDLIGSVYVGSGDGVGSGESLFTPEEGRRQLAARKPRADLRPHPSLPSTTPALWGRSDSGKRRRVGRLHLRHGEHSGATRTAGLNAVWIQVNSDSKQDVDYGCGGHP